jgi:hypothetical protein
MSNNYLSITIDFGTPLTIPLYTGGAVTTASYDLCLFIFPNAFLTLLGDGKKKKKSIKK